MPVKYMPGSQGSGSQGSGLALNHLTQTSFQQHASPLDTLPFAPGIHFSNEEQFFSPAFGVTDTLIIMAIFFTDFQPVTDSGNYKPISIQ